MATMLKYNERKSTDFIAVHCSATRPEQDIGEKEIRQWHTEKGWADVGYNIIIRRSGLIEIGRPIDYQGAHVEGYNTKAIGICMIGGVNERGIAEDNFDEAQKVSLVTALRFCKLYAPTARIQGHRDFPGVNKDCPSFDVRALLLARAPDLLY